MLQECKNINFLSLLKSALIYISPDSKVCKRIIFDQEDDELLTMFLHQQMKKKMKKEASRKRKIGLVKQRRKLIRREGYYGTIYVYYTIFDNHFLI